MIFINNLIYFVILLIPGNYTKKAVAMARAVFIDESRTLICE